MFVEAFRFASEEIPFSDEEFILLYSYLLEVLRFASEEMPLCSEEFILLYSYLFEVFRFASQEIPLCGEEFILHIQVCWTVRFLIARNVFVILMFKVPL